MNIRLTGISSMAMRQVLADVADAWQHCGGEVAFESVGGVEAARRAQDGETFDVVVLAAEAIDKLIATGRILANSKTDLARSAVAIAVRAGAPRPAIDTEAALREAVLSARTIGCSTGPSGVALHQLFRVVPADQVMETALALARRIAANAPLAVQAIKELALRSQSDGLAAGLRFEQFVQKVLQATEDAGEGRQAFADKRPPRFKGN